MKIRSVTLLSVLLITLVGCMSSSKHIETALNLENVGQPENALHHFLEVARRQPDNVQAFAGASRTGQTIIDKNLAAFQAARKGGNHRQAVASYDEAKRLHLQLKGLRINTIWPTTLVAAIKDSREKALREYCEEEYQFGLSALTSKQYRKAYYHMTNVIDNIPNYKDAVKRRQKSLDLGKKRISVVTGFSRYTSHSRQIQGEVIDYLTGLNDPFIEIVDRSLVTTILSELQLNQASLMDKNNRLKAGSKAGVTDIVYVDILDVHQMRPRSSKIGSKKAFSITPILQNKGYTDTAGKYISRYELDHSARPVTTFLYEKVAQVDITANYQIISIKEAKVQQAKNFTTTEKSTTTFAACGNYDYKTLSTKIPDKVMIKGSESVAKKKQAKAHKSYVAPYKESYFTAPQAVKSSAELEASCMQSVAEQLGQELASHFGY